jgi:hypothetical protein
VNRTEVARGIAACEMLAKRLRAALNEDALAEFEEHGTAATWRSPGLTITVATTSDTMVVTDEKAFTAWVAANHPTEVVTTTSVRPAFRTVLLSGAVKRGAPCAADGEVIPGCEFRSGGEFRSVSVRPSSGLAARLAFAADEIVAGRAPLALPSTGSES